MFIPRRFFWLCLLMVAALVQYASAMSRSEALRELGLKPNKKYDEKEIKSAYRKRSLETHPDKGGSNEEFVRVAEAYDVLQGKGGTEGFSFGGGNADTEEKMRQAEDMFFEMFEDFFESGQAADLLVDKIFGEDDKKLTWTQRQWKGMIKRVGRGLLQKAAKFLMENDSLTINVNGQDMTSADLRAWHDKMKKRRQEKLHGSGSRTSGRRKRDDL